MAWQVLSTLFVGWIMTLSVQPSEHRGVVRLGPLPVPGAVVSAVRDGSTVAAITAEDGMYVFPDLPDGVWTIRVEMPGFAPVAREVTIAPDAPPAEWEMRILPIDEIGAASLPERVATAQAPRAAPAANEGSDGQPFDLFQSAADGLLIDGSVNNAAASPFAQRAAFGNVRRTRPVYNGSIGFLLNNSALDARSYSLTGQTPPKPAYNHVIAGFSFGGPMRIPGLIRNGPNFFFNYQRTQNRNVTTQSALVPTPAERDGDFSGHSVAILDPASRAPFPDNRIPRDRISPVARALLNYFPAPNSEGARGFNYQVPLAGGTRQDNMQARMNRAINPRNQVFGDFALQRTTTDLPNIVGFTSRSEVLGTNASANWSRRIGNRSSMTLRYQFSRRNTRLTPHFANVFNVSGEAGIAGNNQEALNWGPPNLVFAGGIARLSDMQASRERDLTHSFAVAGSSSRIGHTLQYGTSFRRQQTNVLAQQDARGTFTFTGTATGIDLADFLLGVPSAVSIAFGNADKYFRQSVYDAYISDDWRLRAGLTLNIGVRWEYEAPMTEKYGRFVNLDIASGFTSAAPVAGRPLAPDRRGLQPRLGLAWRPLAASSLVVRAGYGIYRNSSVYPGILTQMAQQPPLSKSFSVPNGEGFPLTLADGFNVAPPRTPNTFAVDPNFRIGYLHTWTASVQRDLPASLTTIASYTGSKGSRLMQQSLPNTYPAGAANPCPLCPSGFAYLTSNGSSSRNSLDIELRRRLAGGFTANVQYTLSKSIDDAGFSASNPLIAQDWLDLKAERAPSSFDQRHRVTAQAQYTTRSREALLREWTLAAQINASSRTPLTPIYLAPVQGTGITGSIRPDYHGGPLLERSSYTAPVPGHWGAAGRNSITGPGQFGMDASLSRTVRIGDRIDADIRVEAANVLNHVTFPRWNTLVTSEQFGLPNTANAMRKIQSSLRIRF